MLRTLTLALLTLFIFSFQPDLRAQKLDKRTVKVSYIRKPLRPLDKARYQTYSRSLFRGFMEVPNERNLVEQNLRMEGFQPVFQGGDLHIELTLRGLNLLRKEQQSEEENNVQTDFRYRILYAFPAMLTLTDREGRQIDQFLIRQPDEEIEIIFGREGYPSLGALERAWQQQRYEFLLEEEERQLRRVFSEVRTMLADRYAYTTATDKIKIGIGEGRYNYQDLDRAADLAQEGYLNITLKNREKAYENLSAAIELWLAAIQQAEPEENRARINKKILRWLHHNCANAYLWINEYEQARLHNRQASALGLVLNPLSEQFINDMEARYLANRDREED